MSSQKLSGNPGQWIVRILLVIGALIVAGALVWQGVAAAGAPDPTVPHTSPGAAVLSIAVLVFREGLEKHPGDLSNYC